MGLVGCVAGTLRLLRIRDWRLYSIAFLLLPVDSGSGSGTISPLLAPARRGAVALPRPHAPRGPAAGGDHRLEAVPGAARGVAARHAEVAGGRARVGLALVSTLAAWSVIGFAGFSDYRRVLSLLATGEERESFSLASLGFAGGLSAQRLASDRRGGRADCSWPLRSVVGLRLRERPRRLHHVHADRSAPRLRFRPSSGTTTSPCC